MNFEETVYFGCAAYSMLHPHRASELNHLFLVNGNGYEWDADGNLVNVCCETNFKNGKPRKLKSAISFVFKRRKAENAARRKHEREFERDRKANPDKYPTMKDDRLDDLIEKALAAMKAEREKDPAGYDAKVAKNLEEMKEQGKRWKAAQRWEYKVPTDIKKRVAYQTPVVGVYDRYNNWYPICQYSRCMTFPDNIKADWLDGIIETLQLVLANPPQPKPSFPHDPDGAHSLKECQRTVASAKVALLRAMRIKDARHFEAVKRNFPRTFAGVESI
jgi:hypothetical protein